MDSTLFLVLLQLVLARSSGSKFQVEQPKDVEGEEGGSTSLPCSFTYPDTSRPRDINISWKVGNYNGAYIFTSLLNHTNREYRGWIEFLGSPLRDKTGSIPLHWLNQVDSNIYFCSVTMIGEEYKMWQSTSGTVLKVKARSSGSGFRVEQPSNVEGKEGESITLPCSFTYPDTSTPRAFNIRWRVGNYDGTYIFSSLLNHTNGEYRGRIEFLGSPLRDKTGSICLHRLNQVDSNPYFCSVTMIGEEYKMWQCASGTVLKVKGGSLTPTVTAGTPRMQKLSHGSILIIRSVLVLGMLAMVWIVSIYLMKRNPFAGAHTQTVEKEAVEETQF